MKIRARGAGVARALAAVAYVAMISAIPAVAQEKPSLQELLGRAQSQSEKKAVEDLIEKLKPAPKQQPVVETAKPDAKPEAKVQEQQQVRETKPAVVEVEKTTAVSTPAASGADAKAEGKAASARDETPAVDQKAAVATDKPTAPVEAVSKSEPEPAAKATPVPVEVAVERAERKQLPSIDLEVLFEFNSARMTPAAVEALTPLGRALSDERLADGQFLIAGHTDGKGNATYNLELSQRRADAVREFLMENFKIDGSRLVAKGFGETRLKNPQQRRAAENRRVQVVNVTSAAAAR